MNELRSWGRRSITSTRRSWTAAGDVVVGVVGVEAVGVIDAGVIDAGVDTVVDAVSAASPHATTDAVMSNAASTRRSELFTLAAIVIG